MEDPQFSCFGIRAAYHTTGFLGLLNRNLEGEGLGIWVSTLGLDQNIPMS